MAFTRRGSIFDEFEREFDEMGRMMDRMLQGMRGLDVSNIPLGKPIYYGVSVEVGPEGVPRVQQFGNVRPGARGQQLLEEGVREPFVTSFLDEEKSQVHVTAEMPGVDKPSVKVESTQDFLTIRAEAEDRRYEKRLRLGVPVNPDSAKARYHNGVLEVTLDLLKPIRPKGKEVPIE